MRLSIPFLLPAVELCSFSKVKLWADTMLEKHKTQFEKEFKLLQQTVHCILFGASFPAAVRFHRA